MEEKIKEFHRKKRREEIWNTLMLKGIMEKLRSSPQDVVVPVATELTTASHEGLRPETPPPSYESVVADDNISIASSNGTVDWSLSNVTITRLQICTLVLYTVLWLTVWLIAAETGFGSAYLVMSALIGIYLNTRTGPKKEGEISAYSVFNANCEAINGTLKAEQFEREFNLIKH